MVDGGGSANECKLTESEITTGHISTRPIIRPAIGGDLICSLTITMAHTISCCQHGLDIRGKIGDGRCSENSIAASGFFTCIWHHAFFSLWSILNAQDKDEPVLGNDGPVITMVVFQCHSNAIICQRSLPSL